MSKANGNSQAEEPLVGPQPDANALSINSMGSASFVSAGVRRASPWILPALGALALSLLWLAQRCQVPSSVPELPYWAAALVFAALLPCFHWQRNPVGIPFMPVIGVLYAVYYGMPLLIGIEYSGPNLRSTPESTLQALQLAFAGWVSLGVGWQVGRRLFARIPTVHIELDWQRVRRVLPWMLAIGAFATVAQRSLPIPGAWMQPLRFVALLFQVGLGLLVMLDLRGELGVGARRLIWFLLVPAYLFLQVGIGSVAQLAYAGLFLMFLLWSTGRRVPLITLCALGACIFLLRGTVHEFRDKTWREGGVAAKAGPWERSVLFMEMAFSEYSEGGASSFEKAREEVSERVAHIKIFSHVQALTPNPVPHWAGETYRTLPSSFIPRVLWPNKPSKEVGQSFGHRYWLLAPNDRTTSINLPQLIELYVNFGALGVWLGMFAMGLLYQLFQILWNRPGHGAGTLLLGALLFSRLILIESDFSLVYGALLQTSALLILLLRCLSPAAGSTQNQGTPNQTGLAQTLPATQLVPANWMGSNSTS